jgi:hypothetical protein
MLKESDETNLRINIIVILLAVFNITILFMFPKTETAIIVLSYTGAFVLIMQFREMLK